MASTAAAADRRIPHGALVDLLCGVSRSHLGRASALTGGTIFLSPSRVTVMVGGGVRVRVA